MESDLCYRGSGVFPYPYFVVVCPGCLVAAYASDFTYLGRMPRYSPLDPLGRKLGAFLKEQREHYPGTAKYGMAARAYIARGAPPLTIAYLYLRGSWCARHDRDYAAERRYQLEALHWFKEALARGLPTRVEGAIVTYLIGELNRRTGQFAEALAWFGRLPPDLPSWLAPGAREMQALASRGDASGRTLPRDS